MSKDVEKLIGGQIARLRKERELTQGQLAELVDVSTETISRLERGVSIPSLKTLDKISESLHGRLKDLFDFERPKAPKGTQLEQETTKVITYLQTKKVDDIRMCYRILRCIFENIEKSYAHTETDKQKIYRTRQK
jgi:transcriptional regulator with XRE-family HTH domain